MDGLPRRGVAPDSFLARLELDIVNDRANRNVLHRHGISGPNVDPIKSVHGTGCYVFGTGYRLGLWAASEALIPVPRILVYQKCGRHISSYTVLIFC